MADDTLPTGPERQALADAIRVLAQARAQSRAGESSEAEKDARALFETACGALTEAFLAQPSTPEESPEPFAYDLHGGEDGLSRLLATYCAPPKPKPEGGGDG